YGSPRLPSEGSGPTLKDQSKQGDSCTVAPEAPRGHSGAARRGGDLAGDRLRTLEGQGPSRPGGGSQEGCGQGAHGRRDRPGRPSEEGEIGREETGDRGDVPARSGV